MSGQRSDVYILVFAFDTGIKQLLENLLRLLFDLLFKATTQTAIPHLLVDNYYYDSLGLLYDLLFIATTQNVMGVSLGCNGNSTGLQNSSKQVQTPVALLYSLSDKYPWESNEPL